MALTATLHTFTIQLANMDRGTYADLELRVAQQPSETAEFMLMRLLAYCLEYTEGIELTEGVAAGDQPAVQVRDLTGQITAWIEVGAPDADRLHRGSKLAGRAALYTHRNARLLIEQYAASRIHRAEDIPIHALPRDFVTEAAARLQRRSKISVSLTENQLYLDIDGHSMSAEVVSQRLG